MEIRFLDRHTLESLWEANEREVLAPGKPIPLEQVPEAILKTSQQKLPDVKFDKAVRKADGGYEISGKDKKGKVRDVEFSATGEVTELE
jgi:hypothetical protein